MTETLEQTATTPDSVEQAPAAAAADNPTLLSEQAPATAEASTPPAEAEGKDAAQVAAEYEPFQLPEGMVADEELLGEFQAVAKDLKLPQKDAQRFADIGARIVTKQQEAAAKMQAQWIEASKTDKEFGGEALSENLGVAKRALEAFASPELRTMLNTSGLGNHPEVIRLFNRVGKAISEDGRVVTGSRANAPTDPARRLFPNQA